MQLLGLLVYFAVAVHAAKQLDVSGDAAQARAAYALEELSKLSDSGVYSTLSLHSVLAASEEDGIFHQNTMLTLELASPHFLSGTNTEKFEVVVMEHKDDGIRSIAIDEFPVMSEAAIEEFWVQKVEEQRVQREATFRKLELTALLKRVRDTARLVDTSAELDAPSPEELQALLAQTDSPARAAARRKASVDVQRRLAQPYAAQEEALGQLPLDTLYGISIAARGGAFSDFQRERARQMLDAHMLPLVGA